MTALPSWATSGGAVSPADYAAYLRHRSGAPTAPAVPVPHLTDAQLWRLDALARFVCALVEVDGYLPSGYRWLGCSIASRLCDEWLTYYRHHVSTCESARWLVWCYAFRGAEAHVVIPATPKHSTTEGTSAACVALAELGGCRGLSRNVLAWVLTGDPQVDGVGP